MRFEYLPGSADAGTGPQYIVRPENQEEQRFLTILRDVAMNPTAVLRIGGTENLGRNLVGLPPQPVVGMKLILEDRAGKPLVPVNKRYPLDPNLPTSPDVPQDSGGVLHQKGGMVYQTLPQRGGETVVVEGRKV